MKKQDPSAARVSPFLRALALLLDLGLFAGLAVSLVSGIDYLTYSFLGSSGAQFNATLISFPILLLYMLYFSSELMMNKTLGKQLMGIEIRAENGMSPPSEALFRRFTFKHAWTIVVFFYYISNNSILYWVVIAWLGVLAISGLAAFGKEKQGLHDQFANLAVYPKEAPKADLSQLSKGKSEAEIIEETQSTEVQLGTSESVRRTAKATLKHSDFPCAVELNIYVKDSQDIESQIFDAFAQYVPNVHPNQVQLSDKKKGSYKTCRVVMKFDSPAQMERSYAGLAQLPNVITTITVRSVKVDDGKKAKQKGKAFDILNPQNTLS